MEAGDLAVIGADDLDTQDYIFEKLRPHTIRKSTPHCTGGEFYFDPDGQYVICYYITQLIFIEKAKKFHWILRTMKVKSSKC